MHCLSPFYSTRGESWSLCFSLFLIFSCSCNCLSGLKYQYLMGGLLFWFCRFTYLGWNRLGPRYDFSIIVSSFWASSKVQKRHSHEVLDALFLNVWMTTIICCMISKFKIVLKDVLWKRVYIDNVMIILWYHSLLTNGIQIVNKTSINKTRSNCVLSLFKHSQKQSLNCLKYLSTARSTEAICDRIVLLYYEGNT